MIRIAKTTSAVAIAFLLPHALAGCGDQPSDVAVEVDEVRNGNTDLTGVPTLWPRMRHVRRTGGGSCSGVALRGTWVLTARHCVTTDGSILGPIAPRADFTVCHSASPSAGCTTLRVAPILKDNATDVALLRLNSNLGSSATFYPVDTFDPAEYQSADQELVVMGFGPTQPAGMAGTLNWAMMEMAAPNLQYRSTKDGTNNFNGLRLAPLVPAGGGGTVTLPGDSGGPAWGMATVPPSVVAIASTSDSVSLSDYARAKDILTWTRQQIVATSAYPFGWGTAFDTPETMRSFENVFFAGPVTPPAWDVSNGVLTQTNAQATRSLLMFGEVWADQDVSVDLTGVPLQDSRGWAGLAFRYVDASNYYWVGVSQHYRQIRLVRRQGDVETTLAQQYIDPTISPGLWGNAIRWKLYASARGDQLNGTLSEQPQPAGRTFGVSARDSVMPLGRAGIFQSGLGGIKHDNFQIFRVTDPPWNPPVLKNPAKWTVWYDADDPGDGVDDETKSRHAGVCANPLAIEGKDVATGADAAAFAQTFDMKPSFGLKCVKAAQPGGAACRDYMVRYYCP